MLSLSPQVSLFFMTKSASKPATTFFYVSLLFNVCLCLLTSLHRVPHIGGGGGGGVLCFRPAIRAGTRQWRVQEVFCSVAGSLCSCECAASVVQCH